MLSHELRNPLDCALFTYRRYWVVVPLSQQKSAHGYESFFDGCAPDELNLLLDRSAGCCANHPKPKITLDRVASWICRTLLSQSVQNDKRRASTESRLELSVQLTSPQLLIVSGESTSASV